MEMVEYMNLWTATLSSKENKGNKFVLMAKDTLEWTLLVLGIILNKLSSKTIAIHIINKMVEVESAFLHYLHRIPHELQVLVLLKWKFYAGWQCDKPYFLSQNGG